MTPPTDTETTVTDLAADVDRLVAALDRAVGDPGSPEALAARLDDLADVASQVETVAETVDVTGLLDAVDLSDLPAAVDVRDLPGALAEREPTSAVELRRLLAATELRSLWDEVDVRSFWRETRRLEDELDDLFGEDAGAGGDAGEGAPGHDVQRAGDTAPGGSGPSLSVGPGDDGEFDPAAVEAAVQSEVSEAVGEFREGVLSAREQLADLLESNRERTDRRRSSTANNRNPTAVSTMPARGRSRADTTYSTVPQETRHSGAPNRPRIYGTRFDGGGDR